MVHNAILQSNLIYKQERMGPLKTNNYTDLIFHVAPYKFIFWAGTQFSRWFCYYALYADVFVEDEGRLHSSPK